MIHKHIVFCCIFHNYLFISVIYYFISLFSFNFDLVYAFVHGYCRQYNISTNNIVGVLRMAHAFTIFTD